MKQERFTEQAQEAINASQQMAMQMKHSQWDVEHILLALLMQKRWRLPVRRRTRAT
jgi:ATP-dependent Clp protease ATP-binding subunit ClpC